MSTFIKASKFKNVRIPPAEEFPAHPRGMQSYATENGSPAIPVPSTAFCENKIQRAPRQLLPMAPARNSLARIRDEGNCSKNNDYLQGGPSLSCSPHDMIKAALVAMSEAITLDEGKGRASTANASSIQAGPSNSGARTPEGKLAAESDTAKITKGKDKAVHFTGTHTATPTYGSAASRAQEGNTAAVEYARTHRGDPPFYASDTGSDCPTGRASGEKEGGMGGKKLKDSTSS